MNEPEINEEVYFSWLDAGLPYTGWVKFRDGTRAWALNTVEVVGVSNNKYRNKFFATVNVSICVMDKTRIDNTSLNAQKQAVDSKIAMEQKKKEVKSKLIKVVSNYYDLKIYSEKFQEGYGKRIEQYNSSKIYLNYLISDDTKPITSADFPQDLFLQNSGLILDLVKMRNMTAISIPQPPQGEIKREPSGYEKWVAMQDPTGAELAQQPLIQGIATGGLIVMVFISGEALCEAGVFSIETNATAVAVKGGASIVGTGITEGFREISVPAVLSDAFLQPGVGSISSNFVEWKPFSNDTINFRIVGANKTFNEFVTGTARSYIVSKSGDFIYNKFAPHMNSTGEKVASDFLYNVNVQVTQAISSCAIPDKKP